MNYALRLTSAGVLLCLLAGTSQGQLSVDSTLQMVESLYTSGSYVRAELEGRRMLERKMLSDSVRVMAEQWVAFALVAQAQPAPAKEHFMNILRRQPSYELDAILTSPKILAVFNEAKAGFLTAQMQAGDSRALSEAPPSAGITYRTILFPGWEQLYHRRTAAGAVFMGTGIAALGAGITLEFLRSSARKEYLAAATPDDIESRYQSYNRTSKAEAWAFAAFVAVYVASEIDVFLYDSPVTLSFQPANPGDPGHRLLLSFSLR